MEHNAYLPSALVLWFDDLRDRQLGDLAGILVKVLRLWGFAISQILWMLTPLVGQSKVAAIAEALEDPEAMDVLYAHVVEGLPVIGRVEGE